MVLTALYRHLGIANVALVKVFSLGLVRIDLKLVGLLGLFYSRTFFVRTFFVVSRIATRAPSPVCP